MKQAKQRVIAIDYFRGLFILAPVVNHAMLFSMPFAYLTGAGRLWTSAAELLMIISGLTFGIVRGEQIKSGFAAIYKKTLRRVGQIYMVNILVVVLSLLLALITTSHHLTNDVDGVLPTRTGLSLLWSILNLSYSIGWGGFLGLFTVFLAGAPMALYMLRTKGWLLVPIGSVALYIASIKSPGNFGPYQLFAMWQLYFVMGLVLAKLRLPVLMGYAKLSSLYRRTIAYGAIGIAAILLGVCILFEDNNIIYHRVAHLSAAGWLPTKLIGSYQHLLVYKPTVDHLLMSSREGFLRPLFALAALGGMYAAFQLYKNFWLAKTGRIMITLGKNTLMVFAVQAIAIPLLAILPLQRSIANNALLTGTLLLIVWAVTQRKQILQRSRNYGLELTKSFSEAKYAAMYGQEDSA